MNKLSIFFIVAIFAIMSFSIGYKYGDARGYDAGYKEGYTYDCQVEIRQLREEHRQVKEAVNIEHKLMQDDYWDVKRQNDSLRDPVKYNERVAKHVRDSTKWHKVAKHKNDSINMLLYGNSYRMGNFILPSGRVNTVWCVMDKRLLKMAECQPGWRIDQ